MAEFAKDKKVNKLIYSRAALLLVIVVVLMLGLSVISVFQKRQEAHTKAQSAENEYNTLLDRRAHTEAEIKRLQTDTGVEQAIRDKYRAVKDGEELVVVVDKTDQANALKATQNVSFFTRIVNWFKK